MTEQAIFCFVLAETCTQPRTTPHGQCARATARAMGTHGAKPLLLPEDEVPLSVDLRPRADFRCK